MVESGTLLMCYTALNPYRGFVGHAPHARRMPGESQRNDMFYVYILLSQKDKEFYVGSTQDLRVRKAEHDRGKVESTKNRRPLVLICYEAYPAKSEALAREVYLKTSDGRKELRIRLKDTLQKLL